MSSTLLVGVEAGEDDIGGVGVAEDRPGDVPPVHGDQGDVLATCHIDSVTDRPCTDDVGGFTLVDKMESIQPGGEVHVGQP